MGSFAEGMRDQGARVGRQAPVPRFGVVMGRRSSTAGSDAVVPDEQSRPVESESDEARGHSGYSTERGPGYSRNGNNAGGGYRARQGQHAAQQERGENDQASDVRRYQGRDTTRGPSAQRQGEPGRAQGPQDAQRDFHSVHVYGGKAALCFGADETRGQGHTVRVEAAPAKAQRSYDWDAKISLQFTVKELTRVLCVLMGWIPEVEFQAHGPANDKAIALKNQEGGKIFINLRQGKTARAVPVMAEDVFAIIDLVVKQMLKNSPHLTADSLLAVVRAMAARFRGG